jgi:hypothetical protein
MSNDQELDRLKQEVAELRDFADQYACEKLQERYWYAEAIRDHDMIASCFGPDARYGASRGMDEILDTCRRNMETVRNMVIENFHIVPATPGIKVNGDTAHGEVRGIAFIRVRNADGKEKILGIGVAYLNDYVRTREGWKFSAMRGVDVGFDDFHDTTWIFAADPVGTLGGWLAGNER